MENGDWEHQHEGEEEEEPLRPINLEEVMFAEEGPAVVPGMKRKSGAMESEIGNQCIDAHGSIDVTDAHGASSVGMRVVLRVRDDGSRVPCLHGVGLRSLALVPPKESNAFKSGESGSQYSFSRVFGSNTDQNRLFREVCEPVCASVVANTSVSSSTQHQQCGGGGVIMCYGITAAGKTYTIEGSEADPGMLPRTVSYLFQSIGEDCVMKISHYEVYNDQVYDVLGPALAASAADMETSFTVEAVPEDTSNATGAMDMKNRDRRVPLKVMEDAAGKVNVTNCTWATVENEGAAMEVVRRTLKQRATGSTKLNAHSSRSHSVVTIRITRTTDAGEAGPATTTEHSVVGAESRDTSLNTEGKRHMEERDTSAIQTAPTTLGTAADTEVQQCFLVAQE